MYSSIRKWSAFILACSGAISTTPAWSAPPACTSPTWPVVFPTGAYKWDEVKVKVPKGNYSAKGQIVYTAPAGYKACWAKYDEFSGNPVMGNQFSITKNNPSNFTIDWALPCPSGGLGVGALATLAGLVVTAYSSNPAAGAAAGTAVTAAAGANSCGVGGPNAWLDAQWAFILVPTGSTCYSTMPCDARPWIDIR